MTCKCSKLHQLSTPDTLRQLLAILLLCFLFGPFLGHFGYLHLKKRQIKKEVKWRMIAAIDKSELEHFTFAKADTARLLRWKHSREFEFGGEMYDVVSRSIDGDSIHYTVWWDSDETQLNRKLQNLLADMVGHKAPINQGKNEVLKVYKLYYDLGKYVCLPQPVEVLSQSMNVYFNIKPYHFYISLDTPPPEFYC